MTHYRERELGPLIRRALASFPVVVITGMRQSGKTTLLRQADVLRDRRYVTLDDFAALETARGDPETLVGTNTPITIDEVQRCPELLLTLKALIDRDRTPGRFLLSGSASLPLLEGVSESLAGRALHLTLHPFTRREETGVKTPPFLTRILEAGKLPTHSTSAPVTEEEVLLGGMPTLVTGEVSDAALWFLGYEQTYLERDIRELAQVGDLVAFRNVLRLAAARTGQVLNRSGLARDAAMPVATVSRWLGLLETSFVLERLPPHLRNRTARLVKSPKIYIADSGLAGHLTATRDISPESDDPIRGALFETYVHQNLRALRDAHLPDAEMAFWNIQGRHEVDFVLTHGRRTVAIEVKAAGRFDKKALSGLRALMSGTPGDTMGILAYNGTEIASLGNDLHAVPIGLLLS